MLIAVSLHLVQLQTQSPFPKYPRILSWVVVPTSGAQPYVYTAVFQDKQLIDGVNYRFEGRQINNIGSCSTNPYATTVNVGMTNAIMLNNTATYGATIPAGRCLSLFAMIINVKTGQAIQIERATVNNV